MFREPASRWGRSVAAVGSHQEVAEVMNPTTPSGIPATVMPGVVAFVASTLEKLWGLMRSIIAMEYAWASRNVFMLILPQLGLDDLCKPFHGVY